MLQWSDTASEPMAAGLQKPARAPQILRRAFEGQRLQAPTQVLFGANDFYIPVAVLEEIEAHGVDLTIEVVAGCSHWMPEERPDLITDRARALFGRQ